MKPLVDVLTDSGRVAAPPPLDGEFHGSFFPSKRRSHLDNEVGPVGARLDVREQRQQRMLLMRFCEQLQAAMDKPMSDERRMDKAGRSACCEHSRRPTWARWKYKKTRRPFEDFPCFPIDNKSAPAWCIETYGVCDPVLTPVVACPFCGTRLAPGRVIGPEGEDSRFSEDPQ